MEKETYYIIGAGTTTRAVMRELELDNTLIGVDLVYNYELVASDIYGDKILELIGDKPAKLVVTVTGGQGFLFGRGNQQLTPHWQGKYHHSCCQRKNHAAARSAFAGGHR